MATPYRPAEWPLLATAPRAVYQVILPDDPDEGFIVVYEFPDPAGPRRPPPSSRRTSRPGPGRSSRRSGRSTSSARSGPTVVFYGWLPEDAKDASAPGIQGALETLGAGYPVPS